MNVLLADDERSIAITLRDALDEAGHQVTIVGDGNSAQAELRQRSFDLLITDIRMPGLDGISLLKAAKAANSALEVIVITGHGTIETAVEAIRHGAYDYVLKPFLNEDILRKVATLTEFRRLKTKVKTLESQVGADRARGSIIGESEAMRKVLDVVRIIADSDEDVLITGETGTGKELVAKQIHALSPRRDGAFVVLSCSAFPQTLLEDEIFGHEKGAFTDARATKQGRFERANSGVLFLDDIDDVPTETQVKLLRVLRAPAQAARRRRLIRGIGRRLSPYHLRQGKPLEDEIMSMTTVRAFEMKDWEDVAELFLAPNCRWGTMQMPFQSRDDIKKKLENPSGTMHRLVAVDGSSATVIGMLGLHLFSGRRAHAAGLGMFVHDDHQDKGVGTLLMEAGLELADRWLNLRRIELAVYTDNPRAIHLYEKYGFVTEGTFVDFAFRDGVFIDAVSMARVRRPGRFLIPGVHISRGHR